MNNEDKCKCLKFLGDLLVMGTNPFTMTNLCTGEKTTKLPAICSMEYTVKENLTTALREYKNRKQEV
ncbi:MAG: hypothetical protein VKL60_00420 [Sphaerospermopsis sp.]|nr:hypothetical protein [Sphaerospermopsis sp.]